MPYVDMGQFNQNEDPAVRYLRERDQRAEQEAGSAVLWALAIAAGVALWRGHRSRVAERAHLSWEGRHPYVVFHLALVAVAFPPRRQRRAAFKAVALRTETRVVLWAAATYLLVAAELLYQLHRAM